MLLFSSRGREARKREDRRRMFGELLILFNSRIDVYRGGQLRDILKGSEVGVKTILQFCHLGPFTHPLSSSPSVDHGLYRVILYITLHFWQWQRADV